MNDVFHPVLNSNSIFEIHQSKDESFLYSILAALYSNRINAKQFHQVNAYAKYKKLLNIGNVTFPMRNKNIDIFLKNNPKLDISIRLFDSITISKTDMKIYEYKVIGKGRKIINLLFHKSYKNKKSFYHYFWIKNINNIKKTIKRRFVCDVCYEKFSTSVALNRHLLTCNALTKEVYPPENSYISYDDRKAAKYASPLSIMGFADFETKLDGDSSKDDLTDALKSKESFTDRKNIHKIVSFSIIFLDTNGKIIFE